MTVVALMIWPNCMVLSVAAASSTPLLHSVLELEVELELEVDVELELAVVVVGAGVVWMLLGSGCGIPWCSRRYASHHLDSGMGTTRYWRF